MDWLQAGQPWDGLQAGQSWDWLQVGQPWDGLQAGQPWNGLQAGQSWDWLQVGQPWDGLQAGQPWDWLQEGQPCSTPSTEEKFTWQSSSSTPGSMTWSIPGTSTEKRRSSGPSISRSGQLCMHTAAHLTLLYLFFTNKVAQFKL